MYKLGKAKKPCITGFSENLVSAPFAGTPARPEGQRRTFLCISSMSELPEDATDDVQLDLQWIGEWDWATGAWQCLWLFVFEHDHLLVFLQVLQLLWHRELLRRTENEKILRLRAGAAATFPRASAVKSAH